MKWAVKGSYAVADQGILSLTNFLLSIYAVRWLSPIEFGVFAVCLSLALLPSSIFNGILLEPMSVLGPLNNKQRLPRYLNKLIWLYVISTAAITIIFLLVYVLYDKFNAEIELSSLIPGILLFFWSSAGYNYVRRAAYVLGKYKSPIPTTIIYSVTTIGGISIAHSGNVLGAHSLFLISGAAYIVSTIILGIRIKQRPVKIERRKLAALAIRYWSYGKWLVASSILYWISSAAFIPVIAYFLSIEDSGGFRAMLILFFPISQTLTAISMVLLPDTVRIKKQLDASMYRLHLRKIILGFGFLGISYSVLVSNAGITISELIYGDGHYALYVWMLPILGVAVTADSIKQAINIELSAAVQSKAVFLVRIVSVLMTLLVAVPLLIKYGLPGAVFGYMINSVVSSITTALVAKRRIWWILK